MIAVISGSKNELRGDEASGTMACIATVYKNFDEPNSRVRVLISLQDFVRHLMFYALNICSCRIDDSALKIDALLNLGIKKTMMFLLLLVLRVEMTLKFVRL